jgi:hypothetical protein
MSDYRKRLERLEHWARRSDAVPRTGEQLETAICYVLEYDGDDPKLLARRELVEKVISDCLARADLEAPPALDLMPPQEATSSSQG